MRMRYLPDTNIWLALTLSGHPHHDIARTWFEALDDSAELLLCRSTQQSLLRLLTTAAVFTPLQSDPLSNAEAWAVNDALLSDDRVTLVSLEPPALAAQWREFSALPTPSPKRWMDAYLAAFARASDAWLVTNDLAFRSFESLEVFVLTDGEFRTGQ